MSKLASIWVNFFKFSNLKLLVNFAVFFLFKGAKWKAVWIYGLSWINSSYKIY